MLFDGSLASSSKSDNIINIWNLNKGEMIRNITHVVSWISHLVVLKDHSLASCSSYGIYIWNTKTTELIKILNNDCASLISLPNGFLVSGGWNDPVITIWDPYEDVIIKNLIGHKRVVSCLTILKDDKSLASGSYDGMIKIWNTQSGLMIKSFSVGYPSWVTCLSVLKDGNLVSGSLSSIRYGILITILK